MHFTSILISLTIAISAVAAHQPIAERNPGFHCRSNSACPDNFICLNQRCVKNFKNFKTIKAPSRPRDVLEAQVVACPLFPQAVPLSPHPYSNACVKNPIPPTKAIKPIKPISPPRPRLCKTNKDCGKKICKKGRCVKPAVTKSYGSTLTKPPAKPTKAPKRRDAEPAEAGASVI